MNKFLLQWSLKPYQLESYIKAFKRIGIEYDFFSVYTDCNRIGILPEDMMSTQYVTISGIKALKIAAHGTVDNFDHSDDFYHLKERYRSSFFYTTEQLFDQAYYRDRDLPLLNKDSTLITLDDNLDRSFDTEVFIKPTSDLKGFVGGIIKPGQTIGNFIENTARLSHWREELSLIAPVKRIHSEYRFFVVQGEVLAFSRYMLKGKVLPELTVPVEVYKAAQKWAKVYEPDKVFTLDLALLEDESIEIVEYNCFNCSGIYLAEIDNLVKAISQLERG